MLKTLKIALLGLDGAGKTSFVHTIQKKYSDSISPKPTKGIARTHLQILGNDIAVWDFGGQEAYRNNYLRKKESLESIDVVLFIIDVTNPNRFNEAISYFTSLLNDTDLKSVAESNFLFCLHKADPDLVMKDDKILENISICSEKLREINPAATIQETSIFDPFGLFSIISAGIQLTGVTEPDLIKGKLQKFGEQTESETILLLSSDAYCFGEYSTNEEGHEFCESIAFSFIEAWQNITSKGDHPKIVEMELKNKWALFTTVPLVEDYLFLVVYTKSKNTRDLILNSIPKFAEQVSDLVKSVSV